MRAITGCLLCAAVFAVSACSSLDTKELTVGDVPAYATDAGTRLILERPDPHNPQQKVLCSEPSPDISKALTTVLALGGSGSYGPTASGSFQAAGGTSQAIVTLAGRTAAVVALRDGLYQACQAYTNGLIGRDAYALILSYYPDLLVTLMLGEPSGSSESESNATIGAGALSGLGQSKGTDTKSGTSQSDPLQQVLGALAESNARNFETHGGSKPGGPGSSNVAAMYFLSRQQRSDIAIITLCITEAEEARREGKPFPDPASTNLIDTLCRAAPKLAGAQ